MYHIHESKALVHAEPLRDRLLCRLGKHCRTSDDREGYLVMLFPVSGTIEVPQVTKPSQGPGYHLSITHDRVQPRHRLTVLHRACYLPYMAMIHNNTPNLLTLRTRHESVVTGSGLDTVAFKREFHHELLDDLVDWFDRYDEVVIHLFQALSSPNLMAAHRLYIQTPDPVPIAGSPHLVPRLDSLSTTVAIQPFHVRCTHGELYQAVDLCHKQLSRDSVYATLSNKVVAWIYLDQRDSGMEHHQVYVFWKLSARDPMPTGDLTWESLVHDSPGFLARQRKDLQLMSTTIYQFMKSIKALNCTQPQPVREKRAGSVSHESDHLVISVNNQECRSSGEYAIYPHTRGEVRLLQGQSPDPIPVLFDSAEMIDVEISLLETMQAVPLQNMLKNQTPLFCTP